MTSAGAIRRAVDHRGRARKLANFIAVNPLLFYQNSRVKRRRVGRIASGRQATSSRARRAKTMSEKFVGHPVDSRPISSASPPAGHSLSRSPAFLLLCRCRYCNELGSFLSGVEKRVDSRLPTLLWTLLRSAFLFPHSFSFPRFFFYVSVRKSTQCARARDLQPAVRFRSIVFCAHSRSNCPPTGSLLLARSPHSSRLASRLSASVAQHSPPHSRAASGTWSCASCPSARPTGRREASAGTRRESNGTPRNGRPLARFQSTERRP